MIGTAIGYVAFVLALWLAADLVLGMFIGRVIRHADEEEGL